MSNLAENQIGWGKKKPQKCKKNQKKVLLSCTTVFLIKHLAWLHKSWDVGRETRALGTAWSLRRAEVDQSDAGGEHPACNQDPPMETCPESQVLAGVMLEV